MSLPDNLNRVQARIAAAAVRAGRDPASIELVEVYDAVAATWAEAGPRLPTGRVLLGAALSGNGVYLVGGAGAAQSLSVHEVLALPLYLYRRG